MIGIIDFRKASGENIPDIVKYVKDYVNSHSNIEVVVTTDSQTKGNKTNFCTAVIMYDKGSPEEQHGHGAHCIWRKWHTPKYRKDQKLDRLRKEVDESIVIAKELRDNGVTVDLVDIDINPDEGEGKHNESNGVFSECVAKVEWEGFKCTWKKYGNDFAAFPDWIVKR